MAKRKSERESPKAVEDAPEETPDELPAKERAELALATKEDGGEESDDENAPAGSTALATAESDELDLSGAEAAAGQLGTERYVLAGYFASGMLCAYVLGRFVHGIWSYASNKDWLSQTLPRVAAVADDEKTTISFVLGAIAALIITLRTYRRPDVRAWSDEVASELAKVVWPSKKEVTSYTMIVIAASFVATLYLALLDRLWGFITNLVYGDGS